MSTTMPAVGVLEDRVALACRAPSYHNTQPWQWVLEGDGLRLYLDQSRVLPTDRGGRQALISCGAVLDHLRVAVNAIGWRAHVERFPNPNNLDHLATVGFTEMSVVTDGHRARADAISRRRTDRLPFHPVSDWPGFETIVRSRFDADAAMLDVIADSDRGELAAASELTESWRIYDSTYFDALRSWTAPYESEDGIPYSSLVSDSERKRVDVGRTFPAAGDSNRRAQIPADQSTLVVISAYDDTRTDILRCGEMLSTVLLEATMAGLASCTLTHLTELSVSRDIITLLTGRARPQVLVRIGEAPAAEPVPALTPRRPVGDVFTVRTESHCREQDSV